ncbi:MAG: hypothetical protein LBL08_00550 [Candidatus Nomurabacteria bacterium]|jgi:hypothetical protein|nr:hypothetical protein [Candidatus Nomurabacteria bacterium]
MEQFQNNSNIPAEAEVEETTGTAEYDGAVDGDEAQNGPEGLATKDDVMGVTGFHETSEEAERADSDKKKFDEDFESAMHGLIAEKRGLPGDPIGPNNPLPGNDR